MKAEIIRTRFTSVQTVGEFIVYNDNGRVVFNSYTLELDMDGNKEGESCIPNGTYELIPLIDRPDSVKYSQQNYGYFPYLVKDVPNRSGILFHHANFFSDLLGCVAHGDGLVDIDGDGNIDVTNSVNTMKEMNKVIREPITLTIKGSTVDRRDVPDPRLGTE